MNTNVDYIKQLRRQLGFISRSCDMYDNGYKDEAIRIATAIRVLIHSTKMSTSLLKHLNKTDIKLLTSTPEVTLPDTHSFVGLGRARVYQDKTKAEFYPTLGESYPGFYSYIGMDTWWNQMVMILDGKHITRKNIVLGAANKDGGAHVDSSLTDEYDTLSNYHSIGPLSFDFKNNRAQLPIEDAHFVTLRQMGYELLNSPELTNIINTLSQNDKENYGLVDDAHTNRYRELKDIIVELSDKTCRLAIRLVLLDNSGIDSWAQLQEVVLTGFEVGDLDDLVRCGLLASADPPIYGHAKRAQDARLLLYDLYKNTFHEELSSLVDACADQIFKTDNDSRHFAVALITVDKLLGDFQTVQLEPNLQRLLLSAKTLFGMPVSTDDLLGGVNIQHGYRLLAIGLLNTMDTIRVKSSLSLLEKYLGDLTSLAEVHNEPVLRKLLARGIFNTLNSAITEGNNLRRDELLNDLRTLMKDYEEPTGREWLAWGLHKTLCAVLPEDKVDQTRRDTLLSELKSLTEPHREPVVLELLAKSLFNAKNDTEADGDLSRRDELLDELKSLSEAYEEPAVHEWYAKGLRNTLIAILSENNTFRRDELLAELEFLAEAHEEQAVIRNQLAFLLHDFQVAAIETNNPERQEELLEKQEALATKYNEPELQLELAKGLLNILYYPLNKRDPKKWYELMNKLWSLADTNKAPPFQDNLIVGMQHAVHNILDKKNAAIRNELLNHLWSLAKSHDLPAIHKELAESIFNILNDAKIENDPIKSDSLLKVLLSKLDDAYSELGKRQ
jgi:hypothetical protein